MNKIDLSGRCAVVTGGAQGFGLSISKRFIESGAKVMIWDIDKNLVDKLLKSSPANKMIQRGFNIK